MSSGFRDAVGEPENDYRIKEAALKKNLERAENVERAYNGRTPAQVKAENALRDQGPREEIEKIVCSECKRTALMLMDPNYKCPKHRPLRDQGPREEIEKIVCSECKRTALMLMDPNYKCPKHRPSYGVIFSSSGASGSSSGGFRRKSKSHRRKKYKSQRRRKSIKRRH
jgi:hypothetical protein